MSVSVRHRPVTFIIVYIYFVLAVTCYAIFHLHWPEIWCSPHNLYSEERWKTNQSTWLHIRVKEFGKNHTYSWEIRKWRENLHFLPGATNYPRMLTQLTKYSCVLSTSTACIVISLKQCSAAGLHATGLRKAICSKSDFSTCVSIHLVYSAVLLQVSLSDFLPTSLS